MPETSGLIKNEPEQEKTIEQNIKEFSCTLCDQSFADKANFSQHFHKHFSGSQQNTSRSTPSPTYFMCATCMKQFTSKFSLEKHVCVNHENVTSFSCTWCDKSYVNAARLRRHLKVHTNPKPFACSFCQKTFSSNQILTHHIETVHQGLKPFSCYICQKSFTGKTMRDEHVNVVHNKFKAFTCYFCQKSFARKSLFISHACKESVLHK